MVRAKRLKYEINLKIVHKAPRLRIQVARKNHHHLNLHSFTHDESLDSFLERESWGNFEARGRAQARVEPRQKTREQVSSSMFQEFDDVIVITLLVLHHQRIAVLRSRGALRLP